MYSSMCLSNTYNHASFNYVELAPGAEPQGGQAPELLQPPRLVPTEAPGTRRWAAADLQLPATPCNFHSIKPHSYCTSTLIHWPSAPSCRSLSPRVVLARAHKAPTGFAATSAWPTLKIRAQSEEDGWQVQYMGRIVGERSVVANCHAPVCSAVPYIGSIPLSSQDCTLRAESPAPQSYAVQAATPVTTARILGAFKQDVESRPRAANQHAHIVTARLTSYYEVELLAKPTEPSTPSGHASAMSTIRALFHQTQPPVRGYAVTPEDEAAGGARMCVAVGFAKSRFPLQGRLPGWDKYSWGWHSDDGKRFHRNGVGSAFGRPFREGDVVGAGIDYSLCLPAHRRWAWDATSAWRPRARMFFTLNGNWVGYGFYVDAAQPLWPAVGLDTDGPVRVNFGSAPFRFDIRAFEAALWQGVETTHAHVAACVREAMDLRLPQQAMCGQLQTRAGAKEAQPLHHRCPVQHSAMAALTALPLYLRRFQGQRLAEHRQAGLQGAAVRAVANAGARSLPWRPGTKYYKAHWRMVAPERYSIADTMVSLLMSGLQLSGAALGVAGVVAGAPGTPPALPELPEHAGVWTSEVAAPAPDSDSASGAEHAGALASAATPAVTQPIASATAMLLYLNGQDSARDMTHHAASASLPDLHSLRVPSATLAPSTPGGWLGVGFGGDSDSSAGADMLASAGRLRTASTTSVGSESHAADAPQRRASRRAARARREQAAAVVAPRNAQSRLGAAWRDMSQAGWRRTAGVREGFRNAVARIIQAAPTPRQMPHRASRDQTPRLSRSSSFQADGSPALLVQSPPPRRDTRDELDHAYWSDGDGHFQLANGELVDVESVCSAGEEARSRPLGAAEVELPVDPLLVSLAQCVAIASEQASGNSCGGGGMALPFAQAATSGLPSLSSERLSGQQLPAGLGLDWLLPGCKLLNPESDPLASGVGRQRQAQLQQQATQFVGLDAIYQL